MKVLEEANQFVNLELRRSHEEPWYLTFVDGSHVPSLRTKLWSFMRISSDEMNSPWGLIGDFNVILNEVERSRGVESNNHRGMRAFKEVMDYYHLLYAGFEGLKFTWAKRELSMRLDRMVMNLS